MNSDTPQDLTDEVPEADAVEQAISIDTDDVDDGTSRPAEPMEPTAEADAADVWEQSQVVLDEEGDRDREG